MKKIQLVTGLMTVCLAHTALAQSPRIEMVSIPAGSFQMGGTNGDEKPIHRVKISAFKMSKYEVTQSQWKAVMGNNPSYFDGCGGNCPVENVSWFEVQDFIMELNDQTGKAYRLPTEAEWEYAARAGRSSKYHWGDYPSGRYANGDQEYGWPRDGYEKVAPVGSFKPNKFGLYDMSGNVWEWVQDCWNNNYKGAPSDGRAWMSGDCDLAVLRGGSWLLTPDTLRSAYRSLHTRSSRGLSRGFRLVQDR